MRKEFRDSINTALHNPNLTGALGRFSEAYRISREKAYEGIDFEAVRTQIAERKGYAASHLDELAEPFTRNAEARGTKSSAPTIQPQVREYILNLAQAERRQERRQVQVDGLGGDSPQSLIWRKPASRSAKPILGEWIIQLAGQTPSHMVMPAIHMTKEEVADVFSDQVEEGPDARHSEAGEVRPRQAAH